MSQRTETFYKCDVCNKESNKRSFLIGCKAYNTNESMTLHIDGQIYEDFCSKCYWKVHGLINKLENGLNEED